VFLERLEKPVSWIHQLGKDECVRLAATFGMELDGAEELAKYTCMGVRTRARRKET
jgi:hypothetical protein